MAPRIPQQIDAEIYDLLNSAISSGNSISDFQLQSLIRKAKSLNGAEKYACLSALYSHSFNYELVIENALNSIKFGSDNNHCVDNALSALGNNMLLSEVVDIAHNYPIVLNYSDSRESVYEAALYTFNLDYCEYISNTYPLDLNNHLDYKCLVNYFDEDKGLINRAKEYASYILSGVTELCKKYKVHSKHFAFGVVGDPIEPHLEYSILPLNISIDTAIDFEEEWHSHIAKYEISDDKLCNISFVVRIDE
ncbi:hypothetical protein [Vibrio cholerae]|uniref:hypothetical protein n=1 Tax=Vibrio cholerae TaxID=666 RepID=UPI0011D82DB4|nr:hypothetical protein [Vibrio cholerae]TXX73392.1 hypothetical protein FXE98_03050 [Vibrio cholerae]